MAAERARREALVPVVIRARAEAFVKAERGINAEEKFVVSLRTRQLGERLERHQRTERELLLMADDLADSMGRGMRSRMQLDALEERVVALRVGIRKANDHRDALDAITAAEARGEVEKATELRLKLEGTTVGKVKTAAELVAEELKTAAVLADGLEGCPKCAWWLMASAGEAYSNTRAPPASPLPEDAASQRRREGSGGEAAAPSRSARRACTTSASCSALSSSVS